jgi:hypothetical protein
MSKLEAEPVITSSFNKLKSELWYITIKFAYSFN